MLRQKGLPVLLVALFLVQVALPFADAAETSGRAGPDFQVAGMKFDGAGSVSYTHLTLPTKRRV